MGKLFGFVALLVVVGAGLYLYTKDVETVVPAKSATKTVEMTAVRNDLIALANAERNYFASNGKYASLEELQTNGDIHIPHRDSYTYSAQLSASGFTIAAAYSGTDPAAPKRMSIDETMALKGN
jgi:hypothetical protein